MTKDPTGADQTVALLKIQGLLAGAYDVARRTDHKFLSYLIKMARMEVRAQFDTKETAMDKLDKPGGVEQL